MAAIAVGGRRTPLGGTPLGGVFTGLDAYPRVGDPQLKELAAAALDAAKAAGASYADACFTLTRIEWIRFMGSSGYGILQNSEKAAIGVRVLVDGAWGFTASPLWTLEEAARLGREAASQARTNAQGGRRKITLGDPPPVAVGEWRTPIERDPFSVSIEEKIAVAYAFAETASRSNLGATVASVGAGMDTWFQRQEKTFASTDGSFVSQTLYLAKPSFSIGVTTPKGMAGRSSDILQPATGGWELVAEAKLADEMPRLIEDSLFMIDAVRVIPDRYDIVFDARATAQILARTVGIAAELDRVLGFEANAGGTTYLAPPEDMLGKFAIGPELLNVKGNRSRPGGVSTVHWDDDGVQPVDYTVVDKGVLVDYHTTRELVSEIAPYYAKSGHPARSHGCASRDSAIGVPMVVPPNIEMVPGSTDTTFEDLVSSLEKGLVICAGGVYADRQQLNGEVDGEFVYEVRKGKRTRAISHTEVLFRAPELWKSLQAIGGRGTQHWSGTSVYKGQPSQECSFGVGAVPARFKKVPVTDNMRKA
ncbi:MAG TPA: TldD/PmbA family protein [Gemmatimonadaceae bacterium]|nr:TldD/PmbA family protein [Gemmatimonadaceae bacterium]